MTGNTSTPSSAREMEIFLGALELPVQDRAEFIKERCGTDAGLRQSVGELLREQEAVGDFLEQPAASIPEGAPRHGPHKTEVASIEGPGQRIGRYKLLQIIGEGGCGSVYMAEQEHPVRRRVALKIIKLGMDTRQVIARFEAERQALAMMSHPNIATVLEAGATETGRPYFVMELVRGVKITEYCDQHNLSTRERIALFMQVCNAVQHAHQKGIIHRDIKPSNILVTLHDGTPVPKVIDFGVAKATNHQRLTDKTVFTAFEQFIGTPAYMSPEQAEMSGLDVDTRSDIYSLGVLLYELLTGKTPFDAENLMRSGLDACRRTIRESDPVRPSNRLATMVDADLTSAANRRRTEPPKLISMLRGDLDWVVMKCLEKDRVRRYVTANELALDVQRYLDGEPVMARPPSGWYRFQKFVRKNRGAVGAVAAVFVTLLAGAGVSTWQAVRATRAEQEAHVLQQAEARLRRQAETGWERAREQTSLARLNEYVADINLAQGSLAAGNYGRAVQLLGKQVTHGGTPDLRGFEWRYLWQMSKGDSRISFPQQSSPVLSVSMHPANNLLAVSSFENLNVYDLRTRAPLTTLPKGAVSTVFTPDGQSLITASMSGIRVWDTARWTELRSIGNCSGPLALAANGSRVAAATRGGIRVWNHPAWEEMPDLPEANPPFAFSPDGSKLAAVSEHGLALWDLNSTNPTVPTKVLESSTNLFPRPGPRFWGERVIAFSPDGRMLVAAQNTPSSEGVFILRMWHAETGAYLGSLPGDPDHVEHTGVISSLAFSGDGGTLATASLDHSVRLWDLRNDKRRATFQGHIAEIWTLTISPDGENVVTGAKNGAVYLWPTKAKPRSNEISGSWQPVAFSPDAKNLLALDHRGLLGFIDVATQEPKQLLELSDWRFPRPLSSVSATSDLKTVAEGLENGTVKLWNTRTRESTLLQVSERPVGIARISPNGRDLVAAGFGESLNWRDLVSGTNRKLPVDGHRALFSPDGSLLAVFSRNDSVSIWDIATHTLRTNLVLDPPPGFAAAFTPDSRGLAVSAGRGGTDDAIRLWDISRGRLVGTFTGHKQAVHALAFSPDGQTLVSASDDSTLKMWNVATRQELLTVRRLGAAINNLLFSPDCQVLAAGRGGFGQSAELRLYRAPYPLEEELLE